VLFIFAVVMASFVMHDAGGVKTAVRGPIKLVGVVESETVFDIGVDICASAVAAQRRRIASDSFRIEKCPILIGIVLIFPATE
jgi:hypothetical protein